jgi:gamma-glutamylcyclotransferase (GGCT)/AIG2-like uncharacterized protein YtfP
MTEHCFTYGSLMCADIMADVTGQAVAGQPARLAGYVRHPVADEDYPGLVPDPSGMVDGILYPGLSAAALARLDAFEGEMYERRRLRVNPVGGGEAEAWCYIFRDQYRGRLLDGDWDFAAFLGGGKARFLARYMGFAALEADN